MWERCFGQPDTSDLLVSRELFKLCELVTEGSAVLIVRFRMNRLRINDLLGVIGALDGAVLKTYDRIRFDLSQVEELVGPASVHFAVLLNLARRLAIAVEVTGLGVQPGRVVARFLDEPDVAAVDWSSSTDSPSGIRGLTFRRAA
jgi:hypothetical protein